MAESDSSADVGLFNNHGHNPQSLTPSQHSSDAGVETPSVVSKSPSVVSQTFEGAVELKGASPEPLHSSQTLTSSASSFEYGALPSMGTITAAAGGFNVHSKFSNATNNSYVICSSGKGSNGQEVEHVISGDEHCRLRGDGQVTVPCI